MGHECVSQIRRKEKTASENISFVCENKLVLRYNDSYYYEKNNKFGLCSR